MPKVSQRYRDARREEVLAAARRCFGRGGFHQTTMQDLFAESGLSAGAFYRYFASKDELIAAIAEENIRDVLTAVRAIVADSAAQSVGDVLADIVEFVQAKNDENGLAGMAVQVWAEALREPALAQQVGELLGELAEIVRSHQVAGDLPAAVPAVAIAAALTAAVAGHILQLALLGQDDVAGPAVLRALWPGSG
jgi:AcrR family transcriptional regulator